MLNATPLRVLLADRDPAVRLQCRDAFHRLGCDVVEASDGREALVEALVRRPSVIVIETQLPFVDGRALCEILRSDSITRTVPIIALSDDQSSDECVHIRRAGATAILSKPVEADALVSEMCRLTSGGTPSVASPIGIPPVAPAPNAARGRKAMSKAYERFTTTAPPLTVPALRCPTCDSTLGYQHSHVGGVSTRHQEQWDRFECPRCGGFEYRHRTRKLRSIAAR